MARRMGTYALTLALLLACAMACAHTAYAHPTEEEHNAELEKVLFDGKNPGNPKGVAALEDAAYLCVDFCGMQPKGETKLEALRTYGVAKLPSDSSQINLPGGRYHRQWSHRGWDDQVNHLSSMEDREHWENRKSVLLNTTYKVFGYSPPPGFLSWSPLRNEDLEAKLNSFSALVYYIHILGDYVEDDSYGKFNGDDNGRKIAFARPHPGENNIDMFFELKKHLATLFSDQSDTLTYKQLISDLDALAGKARTLAGGSGVNSSEKFEQAHEYVEELMAILCGSGTHANRVHELLMGENFFAQAFPDLGQPPTSKGFFEGLFGRRD